MLYQNRVRLIKSWDVLFAKLEEHMSSISQMKLSPYFKSVQEFQEEAASWEDRLTRLQQIFDSWIDVQRRWVYLESIFFGSADIKAQLPSEFTRFKSVDTDFVQLMRRISQKPFAMEALQIENLLKQLERQEALMTKIQKALGEYLDVRRALRRRTNALCARGEEGGGGMQCGVLQRGMQCCGRSAWNASHRYTRTRDGRLQRTCTAPRSSAGVHVSPPKLTNAPGANGHTLMCCGRHAVHECQLGWLTLVARATPSPLPDPRKRPPGPPPPSAACECVAPKSATATTAEMRSGWAPAAILQEALLREPPRVVLNKRTGRRRG